MIKFEDVTFGFPQKDLYDSISFVIEEGEHAVLIGSNGTGKTSLLKLMTDPDRYTWEGRIEVAPDARIAFVDQFVKHEASEGSVFDYLAEPFEALQQQADQVCRQMESGENMEALCDRYQQLLDEMEAIDAYDHEVNIKKELALAGLAGIENNSLRQISGGEYKLLSIIRSMLQKPQLLIMDEPDVFLDFENLVGLTRLINGYEGTILVITHNRLLLNQCFDKILHLENRQLQTFPGSFTEYQRALLETKIDMLEHAAKFDEFMDIQRANIERMRDDATEKADPRKGRQLKARVSYLERLKVMKGSYPFIEEHDCGIVFPVLSEEKEQGGEEEMQPLLSVKEYSLAYDRPLLSHVSFDIFAGDKIAIVGANGTGKSSLLRDIGRML
ncbi:MAG: ABC-F family ATP-binding cassette domain-containing protein, partial [Firmicutes bacterium]|nr:ABC-F family ATP-binding cassette domain-containing protein [Bacillota bacterium]